MKRLKAYKKRLKQLILTRSISVYFLMAVVVASILWAAAQL